MKKLIGRFLTYLNLNGDRINPGLGNPNRPTFLSLKQAIISFTDQYVKKWDKVLDFGCGNMIYKPFFTEKWVKDYVGIDIGDSPEFNENYIVYTGGKTPLNDNEFDVIISTEVFEHVDNPEFYWKELERITKKWGYIFIAIAHLWEYHPYPKHYYNVFFDAIPLIFRESEIIQVKGDVTSMQNIIQLFCIVMYRKNVWLWLSVTTLINGVTFILEKMKICRTGSVDYKKNSMAWNIIVVLQVKK